MHNAIAILAVGLLMACAGLLYYMVRSHKAAPLRDDAQAAGPVADSLLPGASSRH